MNRPAKLKKGSPRTMAFMASIRNKKKGKGVVGDLQKMSKSYYNDNKNMVINKGKDYLINQLENQGKKVLDKGIDMVKTKLGRKSGKGFIGDIGKKIFRVGLDLAPAPKIVRDVGGIIGDAVIDKTGLGMRRRRNKKGGALMPAGY